MATIVRSTSGPSYVIRQVVWTLLGIVEVILGLRFLLRLLGANPASGFTDFIYRITKPLVNPFIGIVSNTSVGSNFGVIEWFTIVAFIVYWLVAWAIIRLTYIGSATPPAYVERA